MPKKQPDTTKPAKVTKPRKKAPTIRDERGRFPKGVSGNPNGRPPKGYSITETIREMMDEQPEIKRALGSKILESALKGDMTAIKLLWSYMDGMPKQEIDQTVKNTTEIDILRQIVINGQSNQPIQTEQPADQPVSESTTDL